MSKTILNEIKVADMTKEDLRQFVYDILDSELSKSKNKSVSEDKVRSIVREMLKKQYRMFWEKSSFFLDKL